VGDPYVYPAEGAYHQYVRFRLVVFRPFVGEVINGKVTKSTPEGLSISLGFFDDIFIPAHSMQIPSEFSHVTNAWVWRYNTEESSPDDTELGISIGDEVKVVNK
jgi:DNA-directed RNA polymerase subunit E'/Rpb7